MSDKWYIGFGSMVHFVTDTREFSSVPIADVLSRLHVEVAGEEALIWGTARLLIKLWACQ